MRLVLPVPPGWQHRELDGQRSEVVVEGTFDAPEVAVLIHHPRPQAASLRAVIETVITEGLAPGEAVIVQDEGEVQNQLGWPMRGVHALVRRADRSDPVEIRLAVFYRFLGHDAAAMAIGRRAEAFQARRAELLELLAQGRPDWNGVEICALADVYR